MIDLMQWLRAQLDDEERVATNRGKLRGDVWTAVEVTAGRWEVVGVGGTVADHLSEWEARHIADHDPARVLREVEAKRLILAEYDLALANLRRHPDDLAGKGWLLATIRAMKITALPYSDRPGYREEWRFPATRARDASPA